VGHWYTSLPIWAKIKPLARQYRLEPTPAEAFLWSRLRFHQIVGIKFRRQHPIDRFIVDFYCHQAKLIIEVDGAVHEYSKEEDAIRQEFLECMGFKVLRFQNEEVLNDIVRVVRQIEEVVKERINK
jgi:very-short-patch-repair endonuclease